MQNRFLFYMASRRPGRHLKIFLEPVASFSQSMGPYRATATPFTPKIAHFLCFCHAQKTWFFEQILLGGKTKRQIFRISIFTNRVYTMLSIQTRPVGRNLVNVSKNPQSIIHWAWTRVSIRPEHVCLQNVFWILWGGKSCMWGAHIFLRTIYFQKTHA